MATTSVGSSTGTTTGTGASTTNSSKMLAGNFDKFLLLLTTQLKNQSPLEPLDTNEFTQQLVQFASVEQQIKSNDMLTALLTATKASTATNALNFVGMEVTADGATTKLENGQATWNLSSPRAASGTVTVRDKTGATVFSEKTTLTAGNQTYRWSGKTNAGGSAPAGDYTISVVATDLSGKSVNVGTEIVGTVDSVDLTGTSPMLNVGSASVPVEKVKSMRKPAA
ncbi:flagellar hook assembly protein FlgD [Alsobacter sp. R-9]